MHLLIQVFASVWIFSSWTKNWKKRLDTEVSCVRSDYSEWLFFFYCWLDNWSVFILICCLRIAQVWTNFGVLLDEFRSKKLPVLFFFFLFQCSYFKLRPVPLKKLHSQIGLLMMIAAFKSLFKQRNWDTDDGRLSYRWVISVVKMIYILKKIMLQKQG